MVDYIEVHTSATKPTFLCKLLGHKWRGSMKHVHAYETCRRCLAKRVVGSHTDVLEHTPWLLQPYRDRYSR